MTDPYSLTLAASMIALVLSAIFVIVSWKSAETAVNRSLRISKSFGIASLILVLFSIAYHVLFGHRPGTPTALPLLDFMSEHRAFWIVLFLLFADFLLIRWSLKKKAR